MTSPETLELKIHTVRNHPVVLDSDLARIYGVNTGRLNEAIKRNLDRFPDDFSFVLNKKEFADLVSQNAIAKSSRGGRRTPPRVFTEHGALMASTVLNSHEAVAMSIYVIRTFVEMREQITTNTAILKRLAEVEKTLMNHDQALWDVYQKLLPLLQPPPEKPKRPIGFHSKKKA